MAEILRVRPSYLTYLLNAEGVYELTNSQLDDDDLIDGKFIAIRPASEGVNHTPEGH